MAKRTNVNRVKETWNTFTGVIRIWGTDFGTKKEPMISYTATVSKKNDDETYSNEYIKVRFSKKCEENIAVGVGETYLDVENGFLSLESWEDKKTKEEHKRLCLVITDASNVEE